MEKKIVFMLTKNASKLSENLAAMSDDCNKKREGGNLLKFFMYLNVIRRFLFSRE